MKKCPRCNLRYPDDTESCFVDGADLVPLKDPRIGSVLGGRYEVERVLAEGGTAVVYVAHERGNNRRCAIKIMKPFLMRNKVVRERFRREAKSTQKLAHPNIIEILDEGETDDGVPFLVMELLEGEPLSDVVARGPLPPSAALPIAIQIARALARAHDFDVIHRDLKPDNVFLSKTKGAPPVAKLLDFGIARSLHDPRLTNAGDLFGTPHYVAPERIKSIDAGASVDIYALGIMLFEMLAGHPPFDATDPGAILAAHMRQKPPSLATLVPDIPEALDQLVDSMLAKRVEDRPVDAHRVESDLTRIAQQAKIAIPAAGDSQETGEQVQQPAQPSGGSPWLQRARIFQQMLAVGYPGAPPKEAREALSTLQSLVAELNEVRERDKTVQARLQELDTQAREGRQRFGFAVDALGVDASKARDAARAAASKVERAHEETNAHAQRARQLHSEILLWEGRTAFKQPRVELATAYRAAADENDRWLAAYDQEQTLAREAEKLASVVTDLEYQLHEIKGGLQRLEASAEQERQAAEKETAALADRANQVQRELLKLAGIICDPLRNKPTLRPLFARLEKR